MVVLYKQLAISGRQFIVIDWSLVLDQLLMEPQELSVLKFSLLSASSFAA